MQRVTNKKANQRAGDKVKVIGWVDSVRSHGQIVFVDLRDRSGLMQVVINPDKIEEVERIRKESVISVKGKIKERPDSMINEDIVTGKIELKAESVEIVSESKTPPFEITDDGKEVNEELRMKYRYLDLRRERMKNNLIFRHRAAHFLRNFLDQRDFVEVETPILTKSTPEGARDFLVPSRNHPGSFYALPQSPQQYKQLLMVGGLEKYFQFARCFRDEDVRADRQAEFTQLDIEISFMSEEEFLDMIEEMFIELVENLLPEKKIKEKPFPRISHREAMDKWGTDRPDLREDKNDKDELSFAFVVDFPMFEETETGLKCEHHPFTRPKVDDSEEIKKNPEKIRARQYDLVLNGEEIGGGSFRTHDVEMLKSVFEVLGHDEEEIEKKFGHLLEAFNYGPPPHGGIAFGFERILMVLSGEENIREVMAFPKTGDGRGLMMNTPSQVDEDQLNELNLKLKSDGEE